MLATIFISYFTSVWSYFIGVWCWVTRKIWKRDILFRDEDRKAREEDRRLLREILKNTTDDQR